MTTDSCQIFTVEVPLAESKRFKALIKAMGWSLKKKPLIEKSLEEIEQGKIRTYDCLEDFIKEIEQDV